MRFAQVDLPPWLAQILGRRDWYGNTVERWLMAFGVFLGVLIVLWILRTVLAARAARMADRTTTRWDDALVHAVRATGFWFLLLVSLYVGARLLILPAVAKGVIVPAAINIGLALQVALWGNALIAFFLSYYRQQRLETDAASVTTFSALGFLARVALWSAVVLLALDNLGVQVTALIAGLGIGGAAIALASQNILADLFSSLSIVLDKPFVLGDFIVVGEFMGTVEYIGLKTTRIRSLSGEQLIFSNGDLLQSRIRNFKRMSERRVLFQVGVTYQTPQDRLAAIPAMLRDVVESQEPVRFDRAHFKGFGDSSLQYEVVYFVLAAEYNKFMDIQQAINLEILRRFAESGIEFAYPTRTVFVQTEDTIPLKPPT